MDLGYILAGGGPCSSSKLSAAKKSCPFYPLWCSRSEYRSSADSGAVIFRLALCTRSPLQYDCILRRVRLVRWSNLDKATRSAKSRSLDCHIRHQTNSPTVTIYLCWLGCIVAY